MVGKRVLVACARVAPVHQRARVRAHTCVRVSAHSRARVGARARAHSSLPKICGISVIGGPTLADILQLPICRFYLANITKKRRKRRERKITLTGSKQSL